MMMLFVNYITPTTPIYEGAFIREGLNLDIGISGFIGKDSEYGRTDFKKGLKADIRLGYNLSTLTRSPFEPYINLGYQMYMYNDEIYRREYLSIGLKMVSRSKTVRVGVDLGGGYFTHHFYEDKGQFYTKLLIGFGYPEVISASLFLGFHSFETSCGWFGCGPDVDLYSAISLQYKHRNYFISATIQNKRIDIGIGYALR